MKLLTKLAVTTALLFSFSISAASLSEKDCASLSELAGSIMEARQSSVPMDQMYSVADNIADISPEMLNWIKTVIRSAYKEPKWSTDRKIEESVKEFRSTIFSICVKT